MLLCLVRLADAETLEAKLQIPSTKIPYEAVRSQMVSVWAEVNIMKGYNHRRFLYFLFICRYYLKCYIFVSQLEALNIPYTVQSFLNSPKEGLVKGLWKNHSHEPQVFYERKHENDSSLLLHTHTHTLYAVNLKPSLCFQAVRLVADLCLEYQVYDPQLWNSLLQKMLGFNLVTMFLTVLRNFLNLNIQKYTEAK